MNLLSGLSRSRNSVMVSRGSGWRRFSDGLDTDLLHVIQTMNIF